jgi:hypothetical protein
MKPITMQLFPSLLLFGCCLLHVGLLLGLLLNPEDGGDMFLSNIG